MLLGLQNSNQSGHFQRGLESNYMVGDALQSQSGHAILSIFKETFRHTQNVEFYQMHNLKHQK